ncbi:MAG TPA: dTDP-4-dehydrorhamnose 3,5-epimerase [Kiritimatiellia bacterium]|nr:dTDP-4-dehydrorhamnose 3,5-epimerase [Kiritimatiellia bacterium]
MSGLNITRGKLDGLILVETRVFPDDRGFFTETYHARKYAEAGIARAFVQDNASFSKRNVLRGLHFQKKFPQGKLVYAMQGEIFDVAVDLRRDSPTYGQWDAYVLSADNHRQLYVPEGFAHGFLVLSETALVMYKCTELYVPSDDAGIIWNDPDVGIEWPSRDAVLSPKDAALPHLAALDPESLPVAK